MPTLTSLNPTEDPAFLAFLRAQGIEEAELANTVAQRLGIIERTRNVAIPRLQEDEARAVQRVADVFENRGLFRSGQRLLRQSEVAQAFGRRRADLEARLADQGASLIQQLTAQIAANRRQAAEEALAAQQRTAVAAAQTGQVVI